MAEKLQRAKTYYTKVERKLHQKTSDTGVYESDFSTVNGINGWQGKTIRYGEGNFSMFKGKGYSEQKSQRKGKYYPDADGNIKWTEDSRDVTDAAATTNGETRMAARKSHTLLDFAHYGSCAEHVRIALKDVVLKFPAELFISSERYLNADGTGSGKVYVSNPYEIDMTANLELDTSASLRVFSSSYDRYDIVATDGTTTPITSFVFSEGPAYRKKASCRNDRELICTILLNNIVLMDVISLGGSSQIICRESCAGMSVRPNREAREVEYRKMDELARVLLDGETRPMPYTVDFDYPHENADTGFVETYRKRFTWPSENGYNPILSGPLYNQYVEGMAALATFYDESYTDGIWRYMVHPPLKNTDRSFSDTRNNDDSSDYLEGTTRFHDMMHICGHLFDTLKYRADSLARMSILSYDGENNRSSSELPSLASDWGWVCTEPLSAIDPSAEASFVWDGRTFRRNSVELTDEFMRILNLESRSLLSMKGTRRGIEAMFGLFGLKSADSAMREYEASRIDNKDGRIPWQNLDDRERRKLYDYELKEYSVVATPREDPVPYGTETEIERCNKLRKDYPIVTDGADISPENTVAGLPVKIVEFYKGDGTHFKYIVPWFDRSAAEGIEGTLYYQMYGGWGKSHETEIGPNENGRTRKVHGNWIFDETERYVKWVRDMDDLRRVPYGELSNGDIYYVENLQNAAAEASAEDSTLSFTPPELSFPAEGGNLTVAVDSNDSWSLTGEASFRSHYFILKDRDNSEGLDGWSNLYTEDFTEPATDDAMRVLYAENIIDDPRGNSPHCGNGRYDAGVAYLQMYARLFGMAVDADTDDDPKFIENAYSCETGELDPSIIEQGFDLSKERDDRRAWFFTDITDRRNFRNIGDPYSREYSIRNGKASCDAGETAFASDLSPYDFETDMHDAVTESAAMSIIAVKELTIDMNVAYIPEESRDANRRHIMNDVLPYVKQMIPSTTIWRVDFTEGTMVQPTSSVDGQGNDVVEADGVVMEETITGGLKEYDYRDAVDSAFEKKEQ